MINKANLKQELDLSQYDALMAAAKAAAQRAYAPYSKFYVGAALLCADGAIITGGNVENASYGLTLCAERAAVVRAIAEGKRKVGFEALALYAQSDRAKGEHPQDGQDNFTGTLSPVGGVTPCGACRQVLCEFLTPDTPILYNSSDNSVQAVSIKDLLPLGFTLP
ncbi:MAG: cytidine deaminase [Vampirovibrionales bacterium]|nr:cytidine deaminase [Vampirovibrionales bacterium]